MASTVRDRRSDGRPDPDTEGSSTDESPERGKDRVQQVKSSHIITEHIDVGVPADEAFDKWTRYDKWSEIFKNESADVGSDRNAAGAAGGRTSKGKQVKVKAKIGPSQREWTAEVTSTEPGHRVRWQSKGPLQAIGATSFHRLDDRLTRIMVEIEYTPRGFLEVVGNFFRMQRRRVRRDLRLFKNYVELEQAEDAGHGRDGGDDDSEGKES